MSTEIVGETDTRRAATSPRTPKRGTSRSDHPGRQNWATWPHYDAAKAGFRGYWYPVMFSSRATKKPQQVTLLGERIMVIRDAGTVYALKDRCPHRGVPLSQGDQQFPGTVSCPYHGWTFDLRTGDLAAVITDGPESPICHKVTQPTYPVEERLGMVWIFVGDGEEATPIDDHIPEELRSNPTMVGARMQPREGNWRFACENGYDEGHAKYLHRTALWRLFKPMPVWNETHIIRDGRWIYRVQDKQYWDAHFPGVGSWNNQAWYKTKPPKVVTNIGNTGAHREVNSTIKAQEFPGFASVAMPGILRIVYPTFIHYEFYVPVDENNHLYVGAMVNFDTGLKGLAFAAKYLGAVRWLLHGQFSAQDRWMVEVTDAPPEKLYRPDDAQLQWRKLAEDVSKDRAERLGLAGPGASRP